MPNDTSDTEIPITKWWIAFAAAIYVFVSIVAMLIDNYLIREFLLLSGWTLWAHSVFAVSISIFLGQFAEYSRNRLRMEINKNV